MKIKYNNKYTYMTKLVLGIMLFVTVFFLSTTYIMKEKKIQGRLNIVNGYSAECLMHQFYTSSGWIKIEGEVGRNGIDGLYYKKKNGQVSEVLVAESKWNSSKLGQNDKNKLIQQMSKVWLLFAMDKLKKYKPLPEYNSIQNIIKNDQYRARLFKVIPVGKKGISINIYTLKNKDPYTFDTLVERKLNTIDLKNPQNIFEKNMLKAYNSCRETALYKYFPTLKSVDVSMLLEGNYLKMRDVREVL